MQEKIEKLNTIEIPRFGNQEKPEVILNLEKDREEIEKTTQEIENFETPKSEKKTEEKDNLLEKVSELYYLDSLKNEDVDDLFLTLKFQPNNLKKVSKQIRKLYKKAGAFEKEKIMGFVCSFN